MNKILLSDSLKKIFEPNKKCIINADIDGIISGILLQHFLNWEVVGYSSCCGKKDDEIWLKDKKESLRDCVFVDLPVCVKGISVIDQHFVAFDNESLSDYNDGLNKINPNILRERVFINKNGLCEYTNKYPFGTAHFVLAVLENIGVISEDYRIDFRKKLGNFELADLVLRADRVISNTDQYTRNCLDWIKWIKELGGKNTENLFLVVEKEYKKRLYAEKQVENQLVSFGCKGVDGDCSNLFRSKQYEKLKIYFNFVGKSLDMKATPVFEVCELGKTGGKRIFLENVSIDVAKKESRRDNIFSFAFVTMRALSLTYWEDKDE